MPPAPSSNLWKSMGGGKEKKTAAVYTGYKQQSVTSKFCIGLLPLE